MPSPDRSSSVDDGPVLCARDLTHPLGLFAHLDFELPAKRLVALIGPTGVGKTSIFRTLISGRCDPASLLLWDGQPLFDQGGSRLRFALVPQKPALIGSLRVKTLLRYAYFLKNRRAGSTSLDARRRRVADALTLAGFAWKSESDRAVFLNQFCANLSGGEEKRLSLALELLDYPDVLLLDEPDSGLDPHTAKRLFMSMQRLVATSSVRSLLLITHSLATLEADDWVVALGTPAPGKRPSHVAYCGPLGRPGEPDGLYHALGAFDGAGVMERLVQSRARRTAPFDEGPGWSWAEVRCRGRGAAR